LTWDESGHVPPKEEKQLRRTPLLSSLGAIGFILKKNEIRLEKIVETLSKRHRMRIKELARMFDVSEMTIRRDLDALGDRDIVINVRGLAMFNSQGAESHYPLKLAERSRLKEKERIGAYAASLVEDGDCIIIDSGTTMERLARNIAPDLKITVLTSNLNIVNCLRDNANISLITSGGYFHQDTSLFESPEGILLINKTRANKVFLSTSGVHQTLGVTCANSYELTTKQAIMESGAKRILLTDSSKFGVIHTTCFASLDDFDCVVTDRNLPSEWADFIKTRKIELAAR
jgi:DeoR family deoxyribose operon repressor